MQQFEEIRSIKVRSKLTLEQVDIKSLYSDPKINTWNLAIIDLRDNTIFEGDSDDTQHSWIAARYDISDHKDPRNDHKRYRSGVIIELSGAIGCKMLTVDNARELTPDFIEKALAQGFVVVNEMYEYLTVEVINNQPTIKKNESKLFKKFYGED
jgi:hypothetical protein